MARELGIDYETLSQLIQRDIIRPSIALPPGVEGATSYRGSLLFEPADVAAARAALEKLNWLAIVTPDSWKRLTDEGLSYTLLSARYARQADTLRGGNRIAFYVTGVSRFAGVAEVTGRRQQKNTVWPMGVFSYRIPLAPAMAVLAGEGVPAKALVPRLEFIGNKEHWEMSFRGTIRLISEGDMDLIYSALREHAELLAEK